MFKTVSDLTDKMGVNTTQTIGQKTRLKLLDSLVNDRDSTHLGSLFDMASRSLAMGPMMPGRPSRKTELCLLPLFARRSSCNHR